jgi:dihydrofolate reductase
MGRKTWESLPDSFRPLPGRHNIVVSRNPSYQATGATLVTSLDEAKSKAGEANEVFIIGGAELYQQAMQIADRLYLTEIANNFEGDAFFPEVLPQVWEEISRKSQQGTSGLEFSFVEYRRR